MEGGLGSDGVLHRRVCFWNLREDGGACLGTDSLAAKYTGIDTGDTRKKKASSLFVDAEGLLQDTEQPEEALTKVQEALALFREVDEGTGVVDTLRLLLHAKRARANLLLYASTSADGLSNAQDALLEAKQAAQAELDQFRATGEPRGEAAMYLSTAEILSEMTESASRDEALTYAREAQVRLHQLADKNLEARALLLVSSLHVERHEALQAQQATTEAARIFEELGDLVGAGTATLREADVFSLQQRTSQATARMLEAVELFKKAGCKKSQAVTLLRLSRAHLAQGKHRESMSCARGSMALFQQLRHRPDWLTSIGVVMVKVHVERNEKVQAKRLAQEFLQKSQDTGDKRAELIAREAMICAHLGRHGRGDVDDALAVVETSLGIAHDLGDREAQMNAFWTEAVIHFNRGDHGPAASATQEALWLARGIGNRNKEARFLRALSVLHVCNEEFEMAMGTALQERELMARARDTCGEAMALLLACQLTAVDGDLSRAKELILEAQAAFHEAGDVVGEAQTLLLGSQLLSRSEDGEGAFRLAAQAENVASSVGEEGLLADVAHQLAQLNLHRTNVEEAARHADEALALRKKSSDPKKLLEALGTAAQTRALCVGRALHSGKPPSGHKVLGLAREAVALAKKLKDKQAHGRALSTMAEVHMMTGNGPEAVKSAQEAATLCRAVGDASGRCRALLLAAEVSARMGEMAAALNMARQGLTVASAAKDRPAESHLEELLRRLETGGPRGEMRASKPQLAKGLDPSIVLDTCQRLFKEVRGSSEEVSVDSDLVQSGLDSLALVAFRNQLARETGLNLPPSLMLDCRNLRRIVDGVVELSRK